MCETGNVLCVLRETSGICLKSLSVDDKTFVEYHADPSAKVTLYYALDAGLGNQVKVSDRAFA